MECETDPYDGYAALPIYVFTYKMNKLPLEILDPELVVLAWSSNRHIPAKICQPVPFAYKQIFMYRNSKYINIPPK